MNYLWPQLNISASTYHISANQGSRIEALGDAVDIHTHTIVRCLFGVRLVTLRYSRGPGPTELAG